MTEPGKTELPERIRTGPAMFVLRILADIGLAFSNLRSQKTRTFLTMLGIVFGVGSVIGMLAIGEGAREESLRFIEQLGVRNILIDAVAAGSPEELQQRRRTSPGLSSRDLRTIEANIESLRSASPRKTLHPQQIFPKPTGPMPELYGVRPSYEAIHHLQLAEGRFFTSEQEMRSAPVCVLGESAKIALFGFTPATGKFLKVNDDWLEVVGVLRERVGSGGQGSAGGVEDMNNAVYIPFNTFQYRFWDRGNRLKDELDGIDLELEADADSIQVAKVVTAILNATHQGTPDFTVTIPAALLAQQKHTQAIFTYVMVAIAAISLLVGGIGIMNIVLATVMERTREIGIRRATGARRADILRQFLIESTLISLTGGLIGIAFGFILSNLIARVAEWKTIVSSESVIVAVGVSAAVGIVFGIYPARKAARIDPIEALRYE
jgi:putative ABC transport system permease protein